MSLMNYISDYTEELREHIRDLKEEVRNLKYPDWEKTPILASGEMDHDGENGTFVAFWIFKDDLTKNQIRDFLFWMGVRVYGYSPPPGSQGDCTGKTIIGAAVIEATGKDFTLVTQRFSTDI